MRPRIRTCTNEPCKPDHLPHKPISSFFSLTSLSLRSKPFFFSILELNVSLPFLLRRRQHGRLRKGAELGLNNTGDLLLFNGDAAFGSLKKKKNFRWRCWDSMQLTLKRTGCCIKLQAARAARQPTRAPVTSVLAAPSSRS